MRTHVYMYACILLTICSQFVHNLFTICSQFVYNLFIRSSHLYAILYNEGRELALVRAGGINSTEPLEKKFIMGGKNLMDCEKNLPEGEKICLNTEEKKLSEFFLEMFMVAQVFDAKEPKSDFALQFHCNLIIISDMLKQGRYEQVKKILSRSMEKIVCIETLMGLFDSLEDD